MQAGIGFHKGLANWKKIVVGVAVAATLVGLGVLAGYFIGQATTTSSNPAPANHPDGSSEPGNVQELMQLPEPGSEAARQLVAGQDTPQWIKDQYTFYEDSHLITGALSAAFLQQFDRQQQLSSGGASSAANSSTNLAPFIRVADDVLNYLRFRRSETLLFLLREYSSHQVLAIESVDPDQLQQEVANLLKLESLNKWYAARWRSDGAGEKPTGTSLSSEQATTFKLQQGSTGRRLLGLGCQHHHSDQPHTRIQLTAQQQQQQQHAQPRAGLERGVNHPGHLQHQQRSQRQHRPAVASAAAPQATRRLHAEAGVIPAIPASQLTSPQAAKVANPGQTHSSSSRTRAAGSAAVAGIPTESPQQTLHDMLCSIAPFSPTGLKGMVLGAADKARSSPRKPSLTCPPKPSGLRTFAFKGIAFKPVNIAVVFHVLRYPQGKILMPPLWDPEAAADNILHITNRFYKDTGIQFSLLEIRHNPKQHPYLLLPTLEAWQHCSANQPEYEAYFPCLSGKARNGTAGLVDGPNRYAIHVFISGSRDQASMCDMAANPPPECASLFAGYANPEGPWMAEPSDDWTEDSIDKNWVFITWDMLNPETRNSARFWDSGGCTLAHELGHFLGLRHTHAGAKPCEGDGLSKADAVPDTPANRQVDDYAASKNLLSVLTGWCVEFRTGKRPSVSELAPFNSCKQPNRVDNIFNLMSYTMDPCCLILTENQIARLQWAIASFRPKMMKAFANAA